MSGFVVIVVLVMVVYFVVAARQSRRIAMPGDDGHALMSVGIPEVGAQVVPCVGTISFSYRNAQGEESRRTVDVEAVDADYFQGYCHKAGETRTFLIARVLGEVVDVGSGELQTASAWSADARRHPDNAPERIDIGRDRSGVALDCFDEPGGIEVCFTGFSKADRYRLESMAELDGMVVRKSVTKGLDFLVAGDNAGPSKLAQAAELGAVVIDEDSFVAMCADD